MPIPIDRLKRALDAEGGFAWHRVGAALLAPALAGLGWAGWNYWRMPKDEG